MLVCCTSNELTGTFWLSDLVFSGLSDAVEASTFGSLTLYRETKFIIGFVFAVTLFHLHLLCCFWHRFKTIDGTEMADAEQTQKMSPFITCEISLCQYVCELVFGVNVFDLDFGSKLILSNNQSRATLGLGNVSHCRASSLYDHLDHCFVVFKHIQQSFLTRRIDVWGNKINMV